MAVTKEVVMIGDERSIWVLLLCVEPDLMAGAAYVTTRDDPGSMGALWRVNLAPGTKSMVTSTIPTP